MDDNPSLASTPSARDQALAYLLQGLRVGTSYRQFQERYTNDFAGFMQDCILWPAGMQPTDYQIEAAQMLCNGDYLAIRGPRRMGKSAFNALAVLWFALTRDGVIDWKVMLTAGVGRQINTYLWPEIHKWANRIKWSAVGRDPFDPRRELLTRSLKLSTGHVFGAVAKDAGLIEGAHASSVLVIMDEAKSIKREVFDALAAMFAGGNMQGRSAKNLVTSTPSGPHGTFYDIHRQKAGLQHWQTMHVTLQMAIDNKQIDPKWAKRQAQYWGVKSAVYRQYVLGEFAAELENGVISLQAVESAILRWHSYTLLDDHGSSLGELDPRKLPDFTKIAVDVGISQDKTTFVKRFGHVYSRLDYYGAEDQSTATMITADRVAKAVDDYGRHSAKGMIDGWGWGAGVYHRLQQMGYFHMASFVPTASTAMKDQSGELRFFNKRSAAWWQLRESLHSDGADIALPPDDLLIGDLTAPTFKLMAGGKVLVSSKAEIKKDIGRSTDSGDAVVMAHWTEPQGVYFA